MVNFSIWLRLREEASLVACIEELASQFGGVCYFGPHVTVVPSVRKFDDPSDALSEIEEEVKATMQELLGDSGEDPAALLELSFASVLSEPECWSQDVFLEVERPNSLLEALNARLMQRFEIPAEFHGFQAPSKKPHLSLLYGENGHSEEQQKSARELVQMKYGEVLEAKHTMDRLEVWVCAGGFHGIKEWQLIGSVPLSD